MYLFHPGRLLAIAACFAFNAVLAQQPNPPQQFAGWRRAAPAIPLMVSLPANARDTASLENFLDKYHPDIPDGDWERYTPEMAALASKKGNFVLPDIEGPASGPPYGNSRFKKASAHCKPTMS